MNYQYDDLAALAEGALLPDKTLDEEKFTHNHKASINATYPSTAHLVQSIRASPEIDAPAGLAPVTGDKSKSWNDYIINVVYDRYALGGRSYSIQFYLGGPENANETHFQTQNYVGQVYTFGGGSASLEGSCGNCKTQSDHGVLSCGQVPLTIQLLHHSLDSVGDHPLKDFTEVEEYLALHLRWRYIGMGGMVVDAEQFPKTKVAVLRGVGKVPQAEPVAPAHEDARVYSLQVNTASGPQVAMPPVYSGYQALPSITEGKPGGLTRDDLVNVSA
jgi:tyrosinase